MAAGGPESREPAPGHAGAGRHRRAGRLPASYELEAALWIEPGHGHAGACGGRGCAGHETRRRSSACLPAGQRSGSVRPVVSEGGMELRRILERLSAICEGGSRAHATRAIRRSGRCRENRLGDAVCRAREGRCRAGFVALLCDGSRRRAGHRRAEVAEQ